MSRSVMAVVLLFVSVGGHVAAHNAGSIRVRGLDAWARESLEHGLERSSVIRRLVREIDRSDLIVHVETSPVMPDGLSGVTRPVANTPQTRYIRITLRRSLLPDVRASTLAHELQHAVEFAQSDARTQAEMFRLFERIGYRSDRQRPFYETAAARRAGARAWMELRGARPVSASDTKGAP